MSNSFGGGTSSGSRSVTARPEAMWAANNFTDYLKSLNTSTVDNTYQNIANNAYELSSQLPNYVYSVDGSDAARQRMENAVYNQAAGRLNKQFSEDMSALNTKLQNQGLSVGSTAYQNAVSSLQDSQYDALNNAAYESIIQGQNAFTNSLNNAVTAGNFTNNARQQSLSEILQILQNSISGYQVQKDIFNAINSAAGQVTTQDAYQGKSNGLSVQDVVSLASSAATIAAAVSDIRLKENMSPVGRLDKDTEGLLLFTDDGMLDVRLLRPEQHVEKEYEYRAFGLLDETAMRQLETGVLLLEGQPPSLPARAQLLAHTSIGESAPYLPERFREKYLKNPSRPVTTGKLWITEGRKHQVKLMIKAVGGHVFYLKRLAIGPVRLDEMLRPGEYRPLTAEELAALMPLATSGGGTAEA